MCIWKDTNVCINMHGLNCVCICAWVYTHRTTNMTIQNKNLSMLHFIFIQELFYDW